MPIDTPQQLRDHVTLAMRVELTTIPPYLYAMYTVADPTSDAARVIRSVVAEEMLHAVLMANLQLALGGEPRFYRPESVPAYPCLLPHHVPDLAVRLERCSPEVIERVFLTIEKPGRAGAPPEADRYETLGQFYHALEEALRRLDATHDLFADPRTHRQFADPTGYIAPAFDAADSGGLVEIHDLASALEACEIVIHQGEGVTEERYADPSHEELTHHAKFLALADGTIPIGEVLPAVSDPATFPFPDHVAPVARFADALYCYTFVVIDQLLAEEAADRGALVGELYRAMLTYLGPTARYLMTLEVGDGEVAGPPFRFHRFTHPGGPVAELQQMAAALVPQHPALAAVAAAIEPG